MSYDEHRPFMVELPVFGDEMDPMMSVNPELVESVATYGTTSLNRSLVVMRSGKSHVIDAPRLKVVAMLRYRHPIGDSVAHYHRYDAARTLEAVGKLYDEGKLARPKDAEGKPLADWELAIKTVRHGWPPEGWPQGGYESLTTVDYSTMD